MDINLVYIRKSSSFKHQTLNCLLSNRNISDGSFYVHFVNAGYSTLCSSSHCHESYVYASTIKLLCLNERAAFGATLYTFVKSTYISAVCMCAYINIAFLPQIR